MTDPTPEPQPQLPSPESEPEPGNPMPRWVPILIGTVLAVMGALAIYTGLRYRDDGTLTEHVRPRAERGMTAAPPGEPGAGASLVMHGNEEDNTPAANTPVAGNARAVISGGPGGVQSTVRIWARRGMLLQVTPAEAMVYVNDTPIGQASQFDTTDEIYDFAAAGSYTVKIVAPDGKQKTCIVTAADDAKQDIATIQAKLD
jgi:hypothetical protein